MLAEPLDQVAAKQLIRSILDDGVYIFSRHAQEEMAIDDMTHLDVANVLRCGIVEPAEQERGTWRYRVRTNKMYVVIAFRSATELRVVTAWRIKP